MGSLIIDMMEYASNALAQLSYVSSSLGSTLGTGLVAHWKMNDNSASPTVEDNIGGHDATADVNTDTMDVTGKLSGGLDFSTNANYATVPYHADFDISSGKPFTICGWVKLRAVTGDSIINQLGGWSLYLTTNFALNFYNASADFVSTGTASGEGTWHFYAVTHDGAGNYKLRVDETTSSHSQAEPTNNSGDLCIGYESRLGSSHDGSSL